MDDHGGGSCGASDLSLEELMEEYSSRPPQVAEWLWCIEYVAKFVKDIRCILDDYGKRINEVLSLRVLEFMFDPTKNDSRGVGVASASEERVEFDLSLSNAAVIRAILREVRFQYRNCKLACRSYQSSTFFHLLLTRTCACHSVHWRS